TADICSADCWTVRQCAATVSGCATGISAVAAVGCCVAAPRPDQGGLADRNCGGGIDRTDRNLDRRTSAWCIERHVVSGYRRNLDRGRLDLRPIRVVDFPTP